MQIIDVFTENEEMYDITPWDASQTMIEKAGFDN